MYISHIFISIYFILLYKYIFNILIGSGSHGFREMASGAGNVVTGASKMIPHDLLLMAFVTLYNHLPLFMGWTDRIW